MDNTVRINGPDPYYLEFDCITMLGGGLNVGAEAILSFKRDVPFRENLPVVIVTPYYIGVPQRMSFSLKTPNVQHTFVGDGILEGWLTFEFRPDGREMLSTRGPFGWPSIIWTTILAPLYEE